MDFYNKKITVMGLGLLGRGVGDVEYLASKGAELIVTDLKKEEELQTSLEKLKKFKNIKFTLGEHKIEDFENRDFILKSASVPLDSVFIKHAESLGIPIKMSTALFSKLTKATIVGITGTRGKTTTTHIIYHVLNQAFKDKKVFLGGNIQGVATLPFLDEVKDDDIVVLELDSWQLQGFEYEKISPHISVFTTFMDDHLNYYKNDRELYFNDKANIFKYQNEDDFLVIGPSLQNKIKNTKSKLIVAEIPDYLKNWNIKIIGEHNLLNITCAVEVLKIFNLSDDEIKTGVESFNGVSGRLEKIKEINGVEIYNDTTATTPDATVVALKSLYPKPVVLIMGGADKNIDIQSLVDLIKTHTKKIIFLPGTGTERLKKDYDLKGIDSVDVMSMEEAVQISLSESNKGEVVILSPGFASFGLFKNEYDRGDQFIKYVSMW